MELRVEIGIFESAGYCWVYYRHNPRNGSKVPGFVSFGLVYISIRFPSLLYRISRQSSMVPSYHCRQSERLVQSACFQLINFDKTSEALKKRTRTRAPRPRGVASTTGHWRARSDTARTSQTLNSSQGSKTLKDEEVVNEVEYLHLEQVLMVKISKQLSVFNI